MQAILMTGTGGPDVLQLQHCDPPQLTHPAQVKVKLSAAGVNPIDTKLRARGTFFPDSLPSILGCDGAGVVVETGAAVSDLRIGDRVWFCHGGLGREPGNYAEYTVLPATDARHAPRRLELEHAAAGPLVLLTAWEALFDRARLQAGQRVLVHAGAGGVGHVAIQLAKIIGARVCTTVSSAAKAEFVRSLGADCVIDYQTTPFTEAVLDWSAGEGVDCVLDTVGGETFRQSLAVVKHYGDLVTLLDPGSDIVWKQARNRNLRIGFELMLTPMLSELPQARAHQGEILDRCADYIDAGRLRLHISDQLPLAQAVEAHARIEAGHVQGKLVLEIGAR